MKHISAARFKDQCLKIMARVAASGTPVVVTKRGRPLVRVVAYSESVAEEKSLAGSLVKETASPYRTGEDWDADVS